MNNAFAVQKRARIGGGALVAAIPAALRVITGALTKKRGPTYTGTKRRKKRKSGRAGKRTARLNGYAKKGRKVRRRGKQNTMINKGVVLTSERSVAQSASTCVYVGHASIPDNFGRRIVCLALVKSIMVELGVNMNDMNIATDGFNSSDRLWFSYYTSSDPGETSLSESFILTGKTYFTLGSEIATWMYGLNDQCEIYQVYFEPGAYNSPAKKLWNLRNARIALTSRSHFKFQNRTVNETGDEDSHDVDNVPLYGRSYSGTGTGTRYNAGTATGLTTFRPFYADKYGLIAKTGDNGVSMKEPPFGQLFDRVKRSGSIQVQPSDIKTDVLTDSVRMPFSTWFRRNSTVGLDVDYPLSTMGKFTFFALEKAIGGLSLQPIVVACEQNLQLSCLFTLGKITYSTSILDFSVANEDVVPP